MEKNLDFTTENLDKQEINDITPVNPDKIESCLLPNDILLNITTEQDLNIFDAVPSTPIEKKHSPYTSMRNGVIDWIRKDSKTINESKQEKFPFMFQEAANSMDFKSIEDLTSPIPDRSSVVSSIFKTVDSTQSDPIFSSPFEDDKLFLKEMDIGGEFFPISTDCSQYINGDSNKIRMDTAINDQKWGNQSPLNLSLSDYIKNKSQQNNTNIPRCNGSRTANAVKNKTPPKKDICVNKPISQSSNLNHIQFFENAQSPDKRISQTPNSNYLQKVQILSNLQYADNIQPVINTPRNQFLNVNPTFRSSSTPHQQFERRDVPLTYMYDSTGNIVNVQNHAAQQQQPTMNPNVYIPQGYMAVNSPIFSEPSNPTSVFNNGKIIFPMIQTSQSQGVCYNYMACNNTPRFSSMSQPQIVDQNNFIVAPSSNIQLLPNVQSVQNYSTGSGFMDRNICARQTASNNRPMIRMTNHPQYNNRNIQFVTIPANVNPIIMNNQQIQQNLAQQQALNYQQQLRLQQTQQFQQMPTQNTVLQSSNTSPIFYINGAPISNIGNNVRYYQIVPRNTTQFIPN
ncbi:hypothetical protein HZS_1870, partial [Henneguya salminicola]